jgi:hypothetical protein
VWQDVSLAITLLMSFGLVLHVFNIWRPAVPKWRLAAHIACDLVALGIIYYLLQANDLVIMPADGPWAGRHETINDATKLGLLVLGVLIAIGLVFDEGKRLLGMQPWRASLGRADLAGVVAARAVRTARVRPTRHPRTGGGTQP